MRAKRALVWLGLAIGLIVLVGVATVGWLVGTESGGRFAWRLVEPRLPDGIGVASFDGALAGPLVLEGVSVETPTLRAKIGRAELQWDPLALFGRVAEIERITIADLDVVSLPATEPEPAAAGAFEMPAELTPPIDIRLARLVLENGQYRASESAEPIVVDRAELAGRWTAADLAVDITGIHGPLFTVAGRASAVPAEPYPVEARLVFTATLEGYPAIDGETEISGDLGMLSIDQRIASPYNVVAQLGVGTPLESPTLAGTIEVDVVTTAIAETLPGARIVATADVEGPPDNLAVDLATDATTADFGRIDLAAQTRYKGDAIEIVSLDLRHSDSGAAVDAAGTIDFGETPVVSLDAEWTGARWPLDDEALVTSESGRLLVDGTLDDYALELHAALSTPQVDGQLAVTGSGTKETLTLGEIDMAAFDGRLTGSAALRFAPSLEARLALEADGIDPGTIAPTWRGRIGGSIDAFVAMADDTISARVERIDLDGRLRDRDLSLAARGTYDDGVADIEELRLNSGQTSIVADGTVAETLDAGIRIESSDLADLWPGLAGQLTADAELAGMRMRPRVTLDATGRGIDAAGIRIEAIDVTADVDVGGEAQSVLEVNLREASVAGTPIESLTTVADGNADSHSVDVTLATDRGLAELSFDGTLSGITNQTDLAWRFELLRAALTPVGFESLTLIAPSSGRITASDQSLDRTCWDRVAGPGRLCLEAGRSAERTAAQLTIAELPLDYLAQLATDTLDLEGELNADAELSIEGSAAPFIDARITSTRGRLVPRAADQVAVDFGPLDARVVGDADGIEAELVLPITSDGEVALVARIEPAEGADGVGDRVIDGRLSADIETLAFLSALTDQIDSVRGSLTGELGIGGTIGEPVIVGALSVSDGSAFVPAAEITLENVAVELAADADGDLTITASADSGGGTVRANGGITLAGGGPGADLSISGERFEAVNTADARILISPELDLSYGSERIDLTGRVVVPEGRITPQEGGVDAVAPTSDEVIIDGDDETAAAVPTPVYANVLLELGDDVTIEASGLTGQLGGSLAITETPGEPTIGSGELRVTGTYEAYGQELEVRTGRLLFAGGPLTRPGLDIEAVRRPAEDILVGARVRGTLAQPELSLFSEPAMEQRQQLSYLVLGRPLDTASSSEESAIANAALALGLRGGNFVSERINRSLGLDEFGIQTPAGQSASSASFVIGKYLSPKLYVSYGVGLFEAVDTLNLRYTISDRWQVLTESSSEGNGGDIVYSVERSSD